MVGAEKEFDFQSDSIKIIKNSMVYLYTDGAYEIQLPDGEMMDIEDLTRYLDENKSNRDDEIELLYGNLIKLNKSEKLSDDFTMLKVVFQ